MSFTIKVEDLIDNQQCIQFFKIIYGSREKSFFLRFNITMMQYWPRLRTLTHDDFRFLAINQDAHISNQF